ncbi:monocarboxylate transporter 12-B-like isoform X5 [Mytilus galloprovincialis]|uniref:monocarboxylate transporter 12-B-like isoform X5 n=1 Tax=Mytilus galloprovincialis TaxID=29158 RepID=UPI003F7CB3F8
MQKFDIYHPQQWLIVLFGFVCCFLGTSITYKSGIIHLEIIENFDVTDVQATWVGSIFNSMLLLSCPMGSLLANTFSCRVCIMTGSVVGLIGFVLTSLTENIYIIYVTYGLIAGGVWILQTVILVELVSLSNLASGFGIAMLCGGFGQLAVPLLAEILENDNHDNVPDIDLPKVFAVSGSLYILSAILCALTARKSSSKYSSVTNLSHGDEKKKTNDIELNDDLEMELFIEKR